MATFVLIHSPLVGALTWGPTALALRQQGHAAIVADLFDAPNPQLPYWRQHAQSVAVRGAERPILVGHSGAGPLLPAIRKMLNRPVGGYIFVDSDLPQDGASRLDLFASEEEAQQFRESAVDGLLPVWTADDLREVIPNDPIRLQFAAELRPLPLAVYEEPLPVFVGFPDAPAAYLHLSPAYDRSARRAQERGWGYLHRDGGHFLMLVQPDVVAAALIDRAQSMPV